MWGSAFSDLAKKALELQEQAKEQASHLAAPTFFNLDAMRGDNQPPGGGSEAFFATPHPSTHPKKATAAQAPVAPLVFSASSTTTQTTPTQSSKTAKKPSSLYGHVPPSHETILPRFDTPSPSGSPVRTTIKLATPSPKLKTPESQVEHMFQEMMSTSTRSSAVKENRRTAATVGNKTESLRMQVTETETRLSPEKGRTEQAIRDTDVSSEPVVLNESKTKSLPASAEVKDSWQEEPMGDAWDETDAFDDDDDDNVELESSAVWDIPPNQEDFACNTGESDLVMEKRTEEMEETIIDTMDEMKAQTEFVNGDDLQPGIFPPAVEEKEMIESEPEQEVTVYSAPIWSGDEKLNIVESNALLNESAEESTEAISVFGEIYRAQGLVGERVEVSETLKANESVQEIEAATVKESIVAQVSDDINESFEAPQATTAGKESNETPQSMSAGESLKTHEVVVESAAVLSIDEAETDELHDVVDDALQSHQESVDRCLHEAQQNIAEEESTLRSHQFEIGGDEEHEADVAMQDTQASAQHGERADQAIAFKAPPSSSRTVFDNDEPLVVRMDACDNVKPPDVCFDVVPTAVLQKLRDEHEAAIASLQEQHENQLKEALGSFNHDTCQTERREMEQRFMQQIRRKEEHVQDIIKESEGYQQNIDALKRELAETQARLQEKESAIGSVHKSHNKNVDILRQQEREMEKAISKARSEASTAMENLESTKTELAASNEAYSTLKARVKAVAAELKERRVECRSLDAKVSELSEANEQLETQLVNLQSQVSEREKSRAEKDKEASQMRERIKKLEENLRTTEQSLKEVGAVGEKALSAYKKKAQNALAVANARAAAATQLKEEAEMEASRAKALSDEAIERARVAEAAGNDALKKAKASVGEMENEKADLEKRLLEANRALEETREEANHAMHSLEAFRATQDKLIEDVRLISHEREEERARTRDLQHQLSESEQRLETLYEEVESLREELSEAKAVASAASESGNESRHVRNASEDAASTSDAEGTIAMLEGELRDANRAIKELKDALKNAIAEQSMNGHAHRLDPSTESRATGPAGNESTPLFFAMEKQAELNTARDEINRLANLLGDAESAKMEAYEAMEDMQRQMQDAEARLHRYEKFGAAAKPTSAEIGDTQQLPRIPNDGALGRDADGSVNLEYLKNIMLRYLNAKTLAEKKALLPVIGAVLCLTPQEQAIALKTLDESGGLEGAGMALFDSFLSTPKRR